MDINAAKESKPGFSLVTRVGALSCFVVSGILLASSLSGARAGIMTGDHAPPAPATEFATR